jgi:glucose-1-phosphate thymidylyltransferase
MSRKGIVLAGGSGTRLYPATSVTSKQLLPVFDKPMIYYSLSTLMLAGIKDILLISTPHDIDNYKKLLSDGNKWGISLDYAIQENPEGLAQALLIAEDYLDGNSSALVLGDNIFYGSNFEQILNQANNNKSGATIFAYRVENPSQFGVVDFDKNNNVLSITEKPELPKSNYAVTGLYYFDNSASDKAKKLKPSKRGELEISELNNLYLNEKNLKVEILGRGYAWLDTGTHADLLEASHFISTLERRQGFKICCPEEIAYRKNWISTNQLISLAEDIKNNNYGKYLLNLIEN